MALACVTNEPKHAVIFTKIKALAIGFVYVLSASMES